MLKYILLFVVYIILHIAIGKILKDKTKELDAAPYNDVLKKEEKNLKLLFRWFSFVYVIMLILLLMI